MLSFPILCMFHCVIPSKRIVSQKTKHKISGVGVRYRLALSQHRWDLQQAWGDQKVLASNVVFSKTDFFSGMMSEKGGPRGDPLLNLFGWRNLRCQIPADIIRSKTCLSGRGKSCKHCNSSTWRTASPCRHKQGELK